MPSSTGLLQSRFGHRLLLSFMLCALVPVGGIALVLQLNLSRQLEEQSRRRLHDGAKSLGYTILQRLETLAYGLRAVAPHTTGSQPARTTLGPFLSITTAPAPPSTAAESIHLEGGNDWLTLVTAAGTAPRFFLSARVNPRDGTRGLVVAEIHPDSLWQVLDPSAIESDAELTVLDQDGRVLFASNPGRPNAELVHHVGGDAGAMGEFEWTSSGETFLASRWALFLKPTFGIQPWSVVLTQPRAAVMAPIRGFRESFLTVLLLSLLVALLLAIGEIRRSIQPLRALKEGADRVAGQDFASRVEIQSGDEFQGLATALNTMAMKLGSQFAELNQSNTGLREEIRERELAERALKETEEQLRQAQKMEAIGTLAGGVAHDFNNLLTVITSYTDLALGTVSKDDPLHEDLEEVAGAARRATGLTRQLLTFSRKQVVDPQILDVNEVVRASERLLRRLIGADIDFRVELCAPDTWIFADQGQVDQVLMNLAVNARDAMPEGGILTIRTAAAALEPDQAAGLFLTPGPFITLIVEDTGVGMSESTRARVFEPFFTTKPPGQGTGLGLSTVYGIVKQSGGAVALESEVGVGTRFTIYLRGVAPESGLTGQLAGASVVRPGEGTVLVAEDEKPVRQLARRVLEAAGYSVLTAEDGEEALSVASAHPGTIELLLTDVVMPKMGGKRLATSLGQTRPEMRVLYMSGYTEQAVVETDGLGQAAGLLQKPFVPEQLVLAVQRALQLPHSATRAAPGQPVSVTGVQG